MDTAISALIAPCDRQTREQIASTLVKFGGGALRFAAKHNVRIHALRNGQRYDEASPALQRLGVDVDAWPSPAAGLFVVEERTVYLRSRSVMTISHEFGHALDMALGGGVYRSSTDPHLRHLFASAKAYVTPYAATGSDEWFAECVRAWVECNDPESFWPRATRARLRRVDPAMYEAIAKMFADLESG